MTTVDPEFSAAEAREARRAKLFTRINAADKWFQVLGLSWATPVLKAAAGDNPKAQVKEIWRLLAVPLIAIIAFLMLWATLAPKVQTSLGAVPGPAAVWEEAVNLHEDAAGASEARRQHLIHPPSPVGQRLNASRLPAHADCLLVGDRWRARAHRGVRRQPLPLLPTSGRGRPLRGCPWHGTKHAPLTHT